MHKCTSTTIAASMRSLHLTAVMHSTDVTSDTSTARACFETDAPMAEDPAADIPWRLRPAS